MATSFETAGIMERQQNLRGIRVVLACSELLNCAALRQALDQQLDVCVVGNATDWPTLVYQMNEFVPELVLAGNDLVSRALMEFGGPFPLFVRLGDSNPIDSSRVIATLPMSASPEQIFETVQQMKVAVLEAKWMDVMQMLQACRPDVVARRYSDLIEMTGKDSVTRVHAEDIRCITAAKNYVRLETTSGEFQTRAPISEIGARLDPAKFIRIHRSVIVNKREIASVLRREGNCVAVTLRNGKRFRIGSTYRHATTQLFDGSTEIAS
ncbi:transcriptional regulator, LytR/AlgR family [Candidatus Koribacter versatilis Ellin345]|uniref:Transcriptional regulator, LytR/AlgR family n=1 Tax=Koribacter versatilis (strain Ellin345) TaxID=204669 RepID=Q1IUM4_KORVE|nr:LytTR family DNA-binding domain-containing protein [Candidatus Koribacter versatilis]ABF39426.1 transcriptional regulator, LytR/AlgR family [Candidatus Koribacter versatilis Ellin345]